MTAYPRTGLPNPPVTTSAARRAAMPAAVPAAMPAEAPAPADQHLAALRAAAERWEEALRRAEHGRPNMLAALIALGVGAPPSGGGR